MAKARYATAGWELHGPDGSVMKLDDVTITAVADCDDPTNVHRTVVGAIVTATICSEQDATPPRP